MIMQMDKSRKEKLEQRRKQEDAQLNKLLMWVAAAIVFEAVVLFIKRFLINYNQSSVTELKIALVTSNVLQSLQYIAPVLMIAMVVWYLLSRGKGKARKLPLVLAGVFAALSVVAIAVYHSRTTGMTFVSALPFAMIVLAFIGYLYQREFFFSTVLSGLGIFALWFYRKAFPGRPMMVYVVFAAVLLVLALSLWLVFVLKKNNGCWKDYPVFPPKTVYQPVWITIGVTALTLISALIAGATVAYYAIFALIVWLFCMVVYYTVRMM